MHRIAPKDLSHAASARLGAVQARIDARPDYAARCEYAATQWDGKRGSRIGEATFDEIHERLDAACDGVRRCHYCEDSRATDIEHFRPKTLYPELCFVWSNYLYACSGCNSHVKGGRFAVIDAQGRLVHLDKARQAGATPATIADHPALLSPRDEEPMDVMMLDITDTFEFVCLSADPVDQLRVGYTTDAAGVLFLNSDALCKARRAAYDIFKLSLEICYKYHTEHAEYARARGVILAGSHRTVWLEMKRQRERIAELRLAFSRVPAAKDW